MKVVRPSLKGAYIHAWCEWKKKEHHNQLFTINL
jgi:hypothetical protein